MWGLARFDPLLALGIGNLAFQTVIDLRGEGSFGFRVQSLANQALDTSLRLTLEY